MMKRISKMILTFILILGVSVGLSNVTHASIYDLLGEPAVVYGGNLTNGQKEEVKRLLEVNSEDVNEFTVTGQDLQNYIGGNPNSRMFSSVKITDRKSVV